MTTQIVYVLISNEEDFYLEELWVSLYSLRFFHPEVHVKVLTDEPTSQRIVNRDSLAKMISEIVLINVPEHYTAKERSRHIKTSVRNIIDGAFLFIDTDTVVCKSLEEIDLLEYDIAAVPECHLPLSDNPFNAAVYSTVHQIFNSDIHDCKFWFNSGVMYVDDNKITRQFYQQWNKNWTYSCFQKGKSQDQPSLVKTDKDMGYVIQQLPDIYNSQMAMSLKYYADAAIVHFWHMDYIPDQSYSPFLSLDIYRKIKETGNITQEAEKIVKNCKISFTPITMPVGKAEMLFLFTDAGKTFVKIYKEGGPASALMLRLAKWLGKLHKNLNRLY